MNPQDLVVIVGIRILQCMKFHFLKHICNTWTPRNMEKKKTTKKPTQYSNSTVVVQHGISREILTSVLQWKRFSLDMPLNEK